MKKLIILIFTLGLIISLIGCEKEDAGIALSDYATRYQTTLSDYETFLSEELNYTYFQMINVGRYNWDYENIKLSQNYQDIMTKLENMSYELSLLGPELTNETLMTHHSDLEYAIESMSNVYKEFTTQYMINAKQPSQYGLYSEVFNLYEALSEPFEEYISSTTNIESYLLEQEVNLDESYLTSKTNNLLRFNYVYTVLASQVAGYSEHTGLNVSPDRTEFVKDNDEFYRISEFSSIIMINLRDFLTRQSKIIADMNIDEPLKSNHLQYYTDFISNYDAYTEVRSTLPIDFFTSYDFMSYQKKSKRPFVQHTHYMLSYDYPGVTEVHFDFDEAYYDEYQFDVLDEHYLAIQRLIFSEEHQTEMAYEHIVLEPIEQIEQLKKYFEEQ